MRLVQPLRQATQAPWLRDPLWTRARMVPAFDIDANWGPTPVDRVSGLNLTTFTRTASATFVDSAGSVQTAGTNVLRRQWDATNRRWGWLVEEARTNLLLRSEEFDNASWNSAAGARTVTANAAVAPNGTVTADRVTADGTSAPHFVSQSLTLTNVTHVYSIFAKAGTNNFLQLRAFSGFGGQFANFDLANGVVGTIGGGATSNSIAALGNGWYRCSMVFTPTATTSSVAAYIVLSAAATAEEINTLTTDVLLWGAQLEAGAFPTSYIGPTLGVTATRDADVWTVTGSNFSRWYNQSEGTVYAHALSPRGAPVGFSDGTTTERFRIVVATTALVAFGASSGSTQFNISTSADSWISPREGKGVLSLRTNDISAVANGGSVVTDTSASLPFVNRAIIGASQVGVYINGSIARLTYWPSRLSNNVLQELTR